jgi:hypothetical protein
MIRFKGIEDVVFVGVDAKGIRHCFNHRHGILVFDKLLRLAREEFTGCAQRQFNNLLCELSRDVAGFCDAQSLITSERPQRSEGAVERIDPRRANRRTALLKLAGIQESD